MHSKVRRARAERLCRTLQAAMEILRVTGNQWSFNNIFDDPGMSTGRNYRIVEIYSDNNDPIAGSMYIYLRKFPFKNPEWIATAGKITIDDGTARCFHFRWEGDNIAEVIEDQLDNKSKNKSDSYIRWHDTVYHYDYPKE